MKYAHARICSVLRKAAEAEIDPAEPEASTLASLTEESEWNLVRALIQLPQVIVSAARVRKPHRLTDYVYEVAGLFHQFYHQCVILGQDQETTRARLQLSLVTKRVLAKVLDLIGIEAPEFMGEKE